MRSTEDDSVTRCPCGDSGPEGLMVQCEECSVWQHTVCMNLSKASLPTNYYCELCSPDGHPYYEYLFSHVVLILT